MEFDIKKKNRAQLIESFVALEQESRKIYAENVKLRAEIKRLQKAEHNNEYKQCQHLLNTVDNPKLAICMVCGKEFAVAY